jgi:hypothetical protein
MAVLHRLIYLRWDISHVVKAPLTRTGKLHGGAATGEYQYAMTKEPIGYVPSDLGTTMQPASRLRFGETNVIEMGTKSKI